MRGDTCKDDSGGDGPARTPVILNIFGRSFDAAMPRNHIRTSPIILSHTAQLNLAMHVTGILLLHEKRCFRQQSLGYKKVSRDLY
jgi:hypothetical protein